MLNARLKKLSALFIVGFCCVTNAHAGPFDAPDVQKAMRAVVPADSQCLRNNANSVAYCHYPRRGHTEFALAIESGKHLHAEVEPEGMAKIESYRKWIVKFYEELGISDGIGKCVGQVLERGLGHPEQIEHYIQEEWNTNATHTTCKLDAVPVSGEKPIGLRLQIDTAPIAIQ
jgi:hypothetical protein